MSTKTEDALGRLKAVDWGALEGLSAVVVGAVGRVLAGEGAEAVLDQTLRANRAWNAAQRKAAVEAIFGVGLWRRRAAWHAGEPHPSASVAPKLLACFLRDLAQVPSAQAARYAGLDPDLFPVSRPPPDDLAHRWSLPDWLAELLVTELGGEAEAAAQSLNVPGPIFIRANTARTSRDELAQALLKEGVESQPTAFSPVGLRLAGRPNLLGLKAHQDGLLEVQDEGSQLLGLLVGATQGECVLDLCAGAGGKALLLANQVGDAGQVHAYDVESEPLERLERRAARAGATNIRVLRKAPTEARFHRVLVDAPCSSLGPLRRGPDVRFRLDPASFTQLPSLQGELLDQASRLLLPGGTLVYGTCTLRQEENEAVAEEFLRTHSEFKRVPPAAPWMTHSMRHGPYFQCLPHRHGTDAFFGAVFEKTD